VTFLIFLSFFSLRYYWPGACLLDRLLAFLERLIIVHQ
jgi:hypothetical protein